MIDAVAAFYDRVANDAQMKTLLGVKASGRARLYPEFPDETLGEGDYPRVTFQQVSDDRQGSTLAVVEIAADQWVWPDGNTGGPAKLAAVDERMLELLNGDGTGAAPGVAWTFGGARIFSREVGARDIPTEPGAPLRRRRIYRLTVS